MFALMAMASVRCRRKEFTDTFRGYILPQVGSNEEDGSDAEEGGEEDGDDMEDTVGIPNSTDNDIFIRKTELSKTTGSVVIDPQPGSDSKA